MKVGLKITLLLLVAVSAFGGNLREADFRDNYLAYDLGKNILSPLPQNALFFVRGDVASMSVDYLQMVEGFRPDIKVIDQEKFTYEWYTEQIKKRFPEVSIPGVRYDGVNLLNLNLIDGNIGKFPIFFRQFKEESYAQKYQSIPWGLTRKILPKDTPIIEDVEQENLALLNRFSFRGFNRYYPPTTFEWEIKAMYAEIYFDLGHFFHQSKDLAKSEMYYLKAIATFPNYAAPYKNLGIMYLYEKKEVKKAADLFKTYLQLEPNDPEREQLEQVIKGGQ